MNLRSTRNKETEYDRQINQKYPSPGILVVDVFKSPAALNFGALRKRI